MYCHNSFTLSLYEYTNICSFSRTLLFNTCNHRISQRTLRCSPKGSLEAAARLGGACRLPGSAQPLCSGFLSQRAKQNNGAPTCFEPHNVTKGHTSMLYKETALFRFQNTVPVLPEHVALSEPSDAYETRELRSVLFLWRVCILQIASHTRIPTHAYMLTYV